MTLRHHWHRFKPHIIQRALTPALRVQTPLWQIAREQVDAIVPGRHLHQDVVRHEIERLRSQAEATNNSTLWCASLILQAPNAALAQEQMDRHPYGYHNKQARLFELIDFNDTFVSAVLSVSTADRVTFVAEAKRAIDAFCKQVRTRCLSDEQYEAIVHGLSREIAVYLGVQTEGYNVQMTNRVDDAFGIDMVITDPRNGQSINVDCKTHSAFYYRLKDLMHEGRLTVEQAGIAEDNGYVWIVNHDGVRSERIVLWRIDEQTYGNIQDFSFVNTVQLGEHLSRIFLDVVPLKV